MMTRHAQRGFTLFEMIMVIVITGIIAGIVAIFITRPVTQYMDVARRAEMSDTADIALRRIARDLRLALPNSVRVSTSASAPCTGTTPCLIEFLPTGSSSCATNSNCLGGGRYRAGVGGTDNLLEFDKADTSFEVLGPMPSMVTGDQVVVYNLGIPGADAYAGNTAADHNRRPVSAVGANSVTITSTNNLPFDSPGHRFHIVTTPVTYACLPATTGGTLVRYWGYPIAATQPTTVPIADSTSAILATNVTSCIFDYEAHPIGQRSGLITMRLTLSQAGESVSLYNAAHVNNQP